MAQYDNMIASRGFSAAPMPYDSSQQLGRLGELAGQLVVGDPNADYRAAQTRNITADTALKEQELNSPGILANQFADLVASNIVADPETSAGRIKSGIVGMYEQGIRAGLSPKQLSEFALSIGGLAGADNAELMNLRAGAGMVTGKDQALTQDRQDQIRTENFGQETSLNNADNATAITREGMEQAGADRRKSMKGPGKTPTLKFTDVNRIDEEINDQTGNSEDNPMLDRQTQTQIRARTEELVKAGESPTSAVSKAIAELTEFQPEVEQPWYKSNTPAAYVPRKAAAGAPATAAPVIRKYNPATGSLE